MAYKVINIHSFNKYLLGVWGKPCIILGTEDVAFMLLSVTGIYSRGETDSTPVHTNTRAHTQRVKTVTWDESGTNSNACGFSTPPGNSSTPGGEW